MNEQELSMKNPAQFLDNAVDSETLKYYFSISNSRLDKSPVVQCQDTGGCEGLRRNYH